MDEIYHEFVFNFVNYRFNVQLVCLKQHSKISTCAVAVVCSTLGRAVASYTRDQWFDSPVIVNCS